LGLTPERIGSYITNLTEFSQTVPFSEIPNYISQKIEEKKKLEEKIQELNAQIQKLEEQKSETQIDSHKINKDKLQWYVDIKKELEYKYGLSADDIPKFASMDTIDVIAYCKN
jgi:TolA-binding protein